MMKAIAYKNTDLNIELFLLIGSERQGYVCSISKGINILNVSLHLVKRLKTSKI